mgnify:FL=1
MATELIVVLDVDTADEALRIVDTCEGCDWFKIGVQLFTRCGPKILESMRQRRKRVMLDLKFHDIPNTVYHAARAACDQGASMFTVHASGGSAMIAHARKGAEGSDAKILAVTILTSISAQVLRQEVGMSDRPEAAVPRLAKLARDAGAHGIVCSPREIKSVREVVGPGTLIVTPGIRPDWSAPDDQIRLMTPREAALAGADYIVVGRPILRHPQPAEAVRLIKEEIYFA